MPDAVMFNLDGVLVDSEQLWNEAKRELVIVSGGHCREDAPRGMMGTSAPSASATGPRSCGAEGKHG